MELFGHGETHELRRIADELQELNCLLRRFLLHPQVTGFALHQIIGGMEMAITGVPVGGTGTFQIGFVPPSGVPLTSGPAVTVDDTNVTLGPVGTNDQFTASVAAGDTATAFNITVTGINGAGTKLSHVFNVPILAAPPVQITDFTLNQTA